MELKAREGDFLETTERLIFDVKGIVQPRDRIIAFLRYYPVTNGKRIRDNGSAYNKIYSLQERYKFLEEYYPHYIFNDRTIGEKLQGVTHTRIKKIFSPADFLREMIILREQRGQKGISSLLQKTLDFCKLIRECAGIQMNAIGITGSCLVGLEIDQSDIDVIIYGTRNASLVRRCLANLFDQEGELQAYSRENIRSLYEFRGKTSALSFDEFVQLEQRKKLQGIYKGTDFYIRCIKDWAEIDYKYEDLSIQNVGVATIMGVISDDSEAFLTPCRYLITGSRSTGESDLQDEIREIVSFRGRYCEVGQQGEEFEARGKIEKVKFKTMEYYRLLLGSNDDDYFKILNI
ncbi:MAG: hypothetical protein EU536_02015 [Promethearchaeota archaeon]|nr:MAG: hypothetical protein EU536_02015 [Candidatus Lokiarchaeota archaeon]